MPRSNDATLLHPYFADHVRGLSQALFAAGIPLRLYEATRSPFRQAELYAQGRGTGTPGRFVTRAKAWQSFHQFGLAADFVFYVDGKGWTWEEPAKGLWDKYTSLCADAGLRTLSFERPHVELPVALSDLQAGRYPAGGAGSPWEDWIEGQIEQWGRAARDVGSIMHPAAPPLPTAAERPPLAFPEGLPPSPFA